MKSAPAMNNVQSMSGGIVISQNAGMENLSGLDSIEGMPGSIDINANDNMENLNGLGKVTHVGADSRGHCLDVVDNKKMGDMTGLDGLQSCGGSVSVVGNSG